MMIGNNQKHKDLSVPMKKNGSVPSGVRETSGGSPDPLSRDHIYHSGSHCKYLTQYHIIWCPKFRYSVLTNGIDVKLKEILQDICDTYHYKIKALEVMPDHIHIFVDCPYTVAPSDIARTLKSISAIRLFREYPELKRFYAKCGALWSPGSFISTIGHISEETVTRYIEEQKHEETEKT